MDCPKCGGEMEKGGIPLINSSIYKPFLPWIREETFEKSNNFPKWLWITADEKIYGEKYKTGYYKLVSYRCKNCGVILSIPAENNYNGDNV